MEPLLSRCMVQAAPLARGQWSCRVQGRTERRQKKRQAHTPGIRFFKNVTQWRWPQARNRFDTAPGSVSSYAKPAAEVSQDVTREEKDHFARVEETSKKMQARSPWMRDGSDIPPVVRFRSAGAMTKGKLLTTPSRMLKLILPLTTRDANEDRKDVEPLALLVHPQQPLSYLERLIQSELPFMWDEQKGRERAPQIVFRAQDTMEDNGGKEDDVNEDGELADGEEMVVDGKIERTGKVGGGREASSVGKNQGVQNAETQDQKGGEGTERNKFVRWSPSTEIGDFIRDAARGKEFTVDIEEAPEPIYVGVPSFQDRTYYLRMRLRKTSKRIAHLADLKTDCDTLAHRGAKQVARLGFLGLVSWWGAVYYLTFRTDLGWDVMEPVTYLVGLSGLIGGYMWFLYHNREVSYRSAMNFTVSTRQEQLYKAKGFNLPQWEMLIEEGNRLRREIKLVAEEYDVDWDETKDEGDEKVREALRKERKKEEKGDEKEDADEKERN